jgi:hypothetical protein
MGGKENIVMCARAPRCLKGGFIVKGEPTETLDGKLYHKECAELQERENNS